MSLNDLPSTLHPKGTNPTHLAASRTYSHVIARPPQNYLNWSALTKDSPTVDKAKDPPKVAAQSPLSHWILAVLTIAVLVT